MKKPFLASWILYCVILLLSLVYFAGVGEVPFHPDESTQIFMSGDLEILLEDATALAWKPGNQDDIRQRYRLLDSPLTRWMIAFGRHLASEKPLISDWDWSQDWQYNQTNGALPSQRLLTIARFSVAWVFPLTLWFAFNTAEKIAGTRAGWINLFLTATNGLVLIHTRRSMAESMLFFGLVFFLYLLLTLKNHFWLLSIPAALAFNAKFSTAPLFLVGFVPILMPLFQPPIKPKRALISLGGYLALFAIFTIALNPVYWSRPVDAFNAAVEERLRLLSAQTSMVAGINPALAPDTFSEKSLALIAQLYLTKPSVADVGNYLAQTEQSSRLYFSRPWNNLYQGMFSGGFLLALTVIGFIWMVLTLFKNAKQAPREYYLFMIAFLAQWIAILASIPLSFQRYYLPLIPFITVLVAYGINTGLRLGSKTRSNEQG
ncbi:MAG: hypothetical protein AB1453_13505 [Chloroflexota bacterium]